MKIIFTCPKCGGHILDHTLTHTESTTEQLVGMDADDEGVYSDAPEDYSERDSVNSYSCGECRSAVAGDLDVKAMIEKGVAEGWLKTEEGDPS